MSSYEELQKLYVTEELIKIIDNYLKDSGYEYKESFCWKFYYYILKYQNSYYFLPWWREKSVIIEGSKLYHAKIKREKIIK